MSRVFVRFACALLVCGCAGSTDEPLGASGDALGAAGPHPFDRGGQRPWFHDEGHPAGFFHTYDAFSECGGPRTIHVFLPRGYEGWQGAYPTIYMLDGNTSFFPGGAAGKSWRVGETLSALQGQVEEVIVIALHPRGDREREYTHEQAAPTRSFGGLADFGREVASCIKPFFDANYRTRPEPENTHIVGSSHGGLASFWIATRHPESFGAAASMSPSFWVGVDTPIPFFGGSGGRLVDSSLLRGVLPELRSGALRPRLWIDWGERRSGGFHNDTLERLAARRGEEMVRALRSAGFGDELSVHVDPVGGHDEDAWAYRFGLVMQRWFAR